MVDEMPEWIQKERDRLRANADAKCKELEAQIAAEVELLEERREEAIEHAVAAERRRYIALLAAVDEAIPTLDSFVARIVYKAEWPESNEEMANNGLRVRDALIEARKRVAG